MGLFRCRTASAQRPSRKNESDDVKSSTQQFTSRLLSCLQSPVSGNQLTPQERLAPEKLSEAEEAVSNLSKYTLRGDTPLSRHLIRNNAQWRATVQSQQESHASQLKEQQASLLLLSLIVGANNEADKKASLRESACLHEKEVSALQSRVDQLGRDAEVLSSAAVSEPQL